MLELLEWLHGYRDTMGTSQARRIPSIVSTASASSLSTRTLRLLLITSVSTWARAWSTSTGATQLTTSHSVVSGSTCRWFFLTAVFSADKLVLASPTRSDLVATIAISGCAW